MAIVPKISTKSNSLSMKECRRCKSLFTSDEFAYTHSFFFPDHLLPVCNTCINDFLESKNFEWKWIDKVCQWADIPFIVKEWTRLTELNNDKRIWAVYSNVFKDDCYKNLGWDDYNAQYEKLREASLIEKEIPLIIDKRYEDLRKKWGGNYSNDQLDYLEDLYRGLKTTQNINGALQVDQAQKICKISLEIDERIRNGDKEVDKFLASYDKLIKTAEFTPKNTKNAIDFDSAAEVFFWLEKKGYQNKFYDNVTRDVIDETLKSIQSYNRKLYINEGGIGDEISKRIQALKESSDLEQDNYYEIDSNADLESYDNDGFMQKDDQEEFIPTEGDDEDAGE